MNVLAIDTHEVVKELKAVGGLTTEIDALRKETKFESDALRKDLDGLRKDLKADVSEHKAGLLKRISISAVGFQTVAIFGAVFALTHALRP